MSTQTILAVRICDGAGWQLSHAHVSRCWPCVGRCVQWLPAHPGGLVEGAEPGCRSQEDLIYMHSLGSVTESRRKQLWNCLILQMAADWWCMIFLTCVELIDFGNEFFLSDSRLEVSAEWIDSDLRAGLLLHANVSGGVSSGTWDNGIEFTGFLEYS